MSATQVDDPVMHYASSQKASTLFVNIEITILHAAKTFQAILNHVANISSYICLIAS